MSKFSELEVFTRVIDEESFSGAARELGVSKSYVSKQISKLEDRLGVQLLQRTTRTMKMTDVGRAFYERARAILDELDAAELAVSNLHSSPRGTLRMSVPMSFGVRYVAPALAEFMNAYPDLEVDIGFVDRTVDLVDEGYDMAVRIGQLEDSSLVARKLAPMRQVLVASPAYLEKHGAPKRPDDLRQHACLTYVYQRTGSTWRFTRDGEDVSVKVTGPLRANNGDALLEAARAGVGVSILPDFFVNADLNSGELVELLPEHDCGRSAIWALYPHNRHLSTKVRLVVDHLAETFAQAPWLA